MAKIKTPPHGQLYHGVFAGYADDASVEATRRNLEDYRRAVGHDVAWIMVDHEWGRSPEFPSAAVNWISQEGAAAYIRLMLRSTEDQYVFEPKCTLESVADQKGLVADEIKKWGAAAAEASRNTSLICEWGTECNGLWFPWNAAHNGAGSRKPTGQEAFVAAYRNLIRTIRDQGANDITWVFHVNWQDSPQDGWNLLETYDPGRDWCDWVGVSLYGAQSYSDLDWPRFSTTMASFIARLALSADLSQRPLVVSEFGFTKNKSGSTDAFIWAEDALAALVDPWNSTKSPRWPYVCGFSWWNEGWQNTNGPDTEMRVQYLDPLKDVFQNYLSRVNVLARPS